MHRYQLNLPHQNNNTNVLCTSLYAKYNVRFSLNIRWFLQIANNEILFFNIETLYLILHTKSQTSNLIQIPHCFNMNTLVRSIYPLLNIASIIKADGDTSKVFCHQSHQLYEKHRYNHTRQHAYSIVQIDGTLTYFFVSLYTIKVDTCCQNIVLTNK